MKIVIDDDDDDDEEFDFDLNLNSMKFECLGENSEKYIPFWLPITKENADGKIQMKYKIRFIDSVISMLSP